jgi:hypothetical protein
MVELQEKFDQQIFAIHPPEGKNSAKYCEASKSANEDNYVQMLRSRWVGARSSGAATASRSAKRSGRKAAARAAGQHDVCYAAAWRTD